MECRYCKKKFNPSQTYDYDCPDCMEFKKRIFENSLDESEKYSTHKLKITYDVEEKTTYAGNESEKIKYRQIKKFYPLIKQFSTNDFDEMGSIKSLGHDLLYFYEIAEDPCKNIYTSWYHSDETIYVDYEIVSAKLVRIPNPDKYILE